MSSNFPVDKLMVSYDDLWGAYFLLSSELGLDEQRAVLGGTAERIYRI